MVGPQRQPIRLKWHCNSALGWREKNEFISNRNEKEGKGENGEGREEEIREGGIRLVIETFLPSEDVTGSNFFHHLLLLLWPCQVVVP